MTYSINFKPLIKLVLFILLGLLVVNFVHSFNSNVIILDPTYKMVADSVNAF
jgi:hypothetical protein